MNFVSLLVTIFGLSLFETISSVDNAIINAEVLSKMGEKAKRWFLLWGLVVAVFVVRGFLPRLLIWVSSGGTSSSKEVIEQASPLILAGGGTFLLFLFFHWLFLETKSFGLRAEKFFYSQGVWFYAVVSVLLSLIVWFALQKNPFIALGAVVGSTAFFIVHGFRENAEKQEQELLEKSGSLSDTSKIFYLMVIDATFSLDGVLGAFAFTFSVPLILLGNGLGAIVVRQLTIRSIEHIKKYVYLKNGAMYSILFLGIIMLLKSFGFGIPDILSPLLTFAVVGYFFYRSKIETSKQEVS